MNEITLHGNVTAEPILRYGPSGSAFCVFTIAINRSYYDRERGSRVELPAVFQDVVSRFALAENAAESLTKGTTVAVTGYLADNSYTPEGSGQRLRRTRLEAADIAVSLRFAIAVVTKRVQSAQPPAEEPTAAEEPGSAGEATPKPARTAKSTSLAAASA